ncbi:hypothetical protein J4711_14805 [Staphylococcus epidermidis]|nr:hypothetical protein [Staphylococcus epidermidis]
MARHYPIEWFAMPYQDGEQQRYIWGATAGMLRNSIVFVVLDEELVTSGQTAPL